EERLAEPRDADEQRMTTGEQTRDQEIDDVALPHDATRHLLAQPIARVVKRRECRFVVGLEEGWGGGIGHGVARCRGRPEAAPDAADGRIAQALWRRLARIVARPGRVPVLEGAAGRPAGGGDCAPEPLRAAGA